MSAAHDPTGIAQGGWREEGAGDKSALNEEMEAETGESAQCIYMTRVFCVTCRGILSYCCFLISCFPLLLSSPFKPRRPSVWRMVS